MLLFNRLKYQSKFPVEDSYRSCDRIVRELHILQLKRTLLRTHAKKHKLQLTQQKREEPNSAETIKIWKAMPWAMKTLI